MQHDTDCWKIKRIQKGDYLFQPPPVSTWWWTPNSWVTYVFGECKYGCTSHELEKRTETDQDKFYVLRVGDNAELPAGFNYNPTRWYAKVESANSEAERLARANTSASFAVVREVARVKAIANVVWEGKE